MPHGFSSAAARMRCISNLSLRLIMPVTIVCACGCGEYSEVLTVSADGTAEASVEIFLPRVPPSPASDGYIPKTVGGGVMPPDILNSAKSEITAELVAMGAVKESLEERIESDGRRIIGKFQLGYLSGRPGAGKSSGSGGEETAHGSEILPHHEGRPIVALETDEGEEVTKDEKIGEGRKLIVYRRTTSPAYFQRLAQAGLRHHLSYPVTQKFTWTFRLKLPGRPVPEQTNGEIGPDGTVTWRFDFGDMMKSGADMRAACPASRPSSLFPVVVPWIVAFWVFFGAVIAAGLYGLKRCFERERDTGTTPDFPV